MSTSTTRLRRSSRIHKNSVDYSSDSDSESESNVVLGSAGDVTATSPGKRVRKRSRLSSPPQPAEVDEDEHDVAHTSQEPSTDPVFENGLYGDIFLNTSDTPIEQVALRFVDNYRVEPADNLAELVNLFIKASGAAIGLSGPEIANIDDAASIFKEFEKKIAKDHPIVDYVFLNKQISKKAYTNMVEFTTSLVEYASEYEMLYLKDEKLFTEGLAWITVISGSSIRSFRHVGTVAGLTIMTKLCDILSSQNIQLQKYEKQLASLNKSKKVNKKAKSGIQELIKTQQLKTAILNEFITDIFNAIFSHRQKDVDGKIRAECVQHLAHWTLNCPERFLENQYLRYFGWALSDLHNTTRLTVVSALTKLYSNSEFWSSLRQFTERFLPRLMEMATMDIDNNVRKSTIDLLTLVQRAGFLYEESCLKTAILIFDSDSKVRRAAAHFFVSYVGKKIESEIARFPRDELEEEITGIGISYDWIRFSVMANVLDETYKTRLAYQQNVLPGFPPHFMEQIRDVMVEERYCKGSYVPILTTASSSIFVALKSDSPLRKWSQLIDFLSFDFSSITDNTSIPRGTLDFIRYVNPENVSQVAMFLDILQGFVHANALEVDSKSLKRKTSKKAQDELDVHNVYLGLLDKWSTLFEKYHYSTELTSKTIRLISLVNYDTYAALHKEADAEMIFQLVLREFAENVSENILIECSNMFSRCCESTRFKGYVKPRLHEAAQDLTRSLCDLFQSFEVTDQKSLDILEIVLLRLYLLSQSVSSLECISKFFRLGDDAKSIGAFLSNLLIELSVSGSVAATRILLVMRNYSLWLLAACIKGETDGNSPEAGIFTEFLSTSQGLLTDAVASGPQYASILASIYLELMSSAKAVISTGSYGSLEDLVPGNSPATVEESLVKVFHTKERAYANAAGIELNSEPEDNSSEPESEQRQSDDELMLCDYDLCKYASKMKLAILSGVLRECIADTLLENAAVLSKNYGAVVKDLN